MIETDLLQSYFISPHLYQASGSSQGGSVTRGAGHPESYGPCHPNALVSQWAGIQSNRMASGCLPLRFPQCCRWLHWIWHRQLYRSLPSSTRYRNPESTVPQHYLFYVLNFITPITGRNVVQKSTEQAEKTFYSMIQWMEQDRALSSTASWRRRKSTT